MGRRETMNTRSRERSNPRRSRSGRSRSGHVNETNSMPVACRIAFAGALDAGGRAVAANGQARSRSGGSVGGAGAGPGAGLRRLDHRLRRHLRAGAAGEAPVLAQVVEEAGGIAGDEVLGAQTLALGRERLFEVALGSRVVA